MDKQDKQHQHKHRRAEEGDVLQARGSKAIYVPVVKPAGNTPSIHDESGYLGEESKRDGCV